MEANLVVFWYVFGVLTIYLSAFKSKYPTPSTKYIEFGFIPTSKLLFFTQFHIQYNPVAYLHNLQFQFYLILAWCIQID